MFCFCSLIFIGCMGEEQSFFGTYTDKSEMSPEWRVVELIEPNFFSTYKVQKVGSKSIKRHSEQGKFIEYDDTLFLETDTKNNRGFMVYFTDDSFNSLQFGTSEWREILHRVK
jgi:hypothetical protein